MPWRPLPTPDGARDAAGDPQRVDGVLDRVLGRLGAPAVDTLVLVYERWADVAGDEVAANSRPLSIDGETLRVGADDAAWASHIRWSETDILDRLAGLLGRRELTRVQVRVTPRR